MDLLMISRILLLRRNLRQRERWSQAQLLDHQGRELAALRAFVYARSPFYQSIHKGFERAPLGELPVLTKAGLMDNYDQVVTDPNLRLADLQAYLQTLHGDERFRGRYWVSATSGSSGHKSIIASDAREWATIIASYGRANEWSGIRSGLTHRVSMAVVSSTTAWHQSSRVAATVRSPFIASQRLDAAWLLPDIVTRLNQLQPDVLIAYASMIRTLADEQLAGRLHISPSAVNSSSEVLTAEARAMATRAWHVPTFNVYAATETGGIAAECQHHHGMHLFEDLVIPEVVDDNYRPVPPGAPGDRLLATVLFGRTIPLIRYEMTDRIRLATQPCPCGLPFRLVEAIEGRTDDTLALPAPDGATITVHSVVFHQAPRPGRRRWMAGAPTTTAAAADPGRSTRPRIRPGQSRTCRTGRPNQGRSTRTAGARDHSGRRSSGRCRQTTTRRSPAMRSPDYWLGRAQSHPGGISRGPTRRHCTEWVEHLNICAPKVTATMKPWPLTLEIIDAAENAARIEETEPAPGPTMRAAGRWVDANLGRVLVVLSYREGSILELGDRPPCHRLIYSGLDGRSQLS